MSRERNAASLAKIKGSIALGDRFLTDSNLNILVKE